MGPTVRMQSPASRALGAVLVLAAVAGLVSTLLGDVSDVLRVGAPAALFGVLGWAAFWRPYVEVSDGGVRVVNTLRTVVVPWPALEDVDGRYGLKLTTAYGGVTAWAAGAPAGRQRARGEQSAASTAVRARWQELRDAGHLDGRRLERPRLAIAWHTGLIATSAALALASVVLPLVV